MIETIHLNVRELIVQWPCIQRQWLDNFGQVKSEKTVSQCCEQAIAEKWIIFQWWAATVKAIKDCALKLNKQFRRGAHD